MTAKAIVLFHGDCDGVISAGLYIRHFLRDYFPNRIILRYTHPWRLHEDLTRTLKSIGGNVDIIVLLDLAVDTDTMNRIREIVKRNRNISIVIVDHHSSSASILNTGKDLEPQVKIYWQLMQSTPEVLASTLIKNLNEYEQTLIKVANVCEGGSSEDQHIRDIADKIKLVLAVEPSNESLFRSAVEAVVKGEDFWNSKEFSHRYSKAKWLLQTLLRRIEERVENICNWSLAVFTAAESIVYAGLFGIASSEYVKKSKNSLLLIREEEKKIVITIRSVDGKALEFCKHFAEYGKELNVIYGGHREAASITIKSPKSLNEVVSLVKEFIRKRCTEIT